MAGLGKGLGALLANKTPRNKDAKDTNNNVAQTQKQEQVQEQQPLKTSDALVNLPITQLQSGKFQPRQDITHDSLTGLVESIRSQGIIEPIVVRPLVNTPDQYEIVAGERRWLAATIADLATVPCIIKNLSDQDTMLIALLENIQRKDLNILDIAEAYANIVKHLRLTHGALARQLGKSRASITNIIRLNDLHSTVKDMLRNCKLEMGHARALLALPNEMQAEVANTVVQNKLSVRATEELVDKKLHPTAPKEQTVDSDVIAFNTQLQNILGDLQFKYVKQGKDKGKITLSFHNQQELEKIKTLLGL